ncbi:hypothetical protein N7447_002683 [Penicillium robsamsonii]|uniref:uncharacterized protein n=1 Tax=Penicillium robsamsonii TaxID=1792511 RepID=UPI0025475569|nr:uncharacterized protein N7447_002683 [Penicillium robsamsonii]KAJ5836657.1 hypothetical protein N7447_002683 [Penicillium robsamsonii]
MEDMDRVINAGIPIAELLYQATGSTTVTVALSVLLTIIYAACVSCGASYMSLRQRPRYSISRFLRQYRQAAPIPASYDLGSMIFADIYGLIYLASTTAFNSIITSAVTLLNLSYAVPQAILATRGRAQCLPKRPLGLGRWRTRFGGIVSYHSCFLGFDR